MIKAFTLGLSALALTAVPVAATAATAGANPAQSLSVASSVRSGTTTSKSSKLAGISIAPLVIGIGMLAGVTYLIVDHEDDNNSDSN